MNAKEKRVAGLLEQALDSLAELGEQSFCGPIHGARGAIISAINRSSGTADPPDGHPRAQPRCQDGIGR